MRSETHAALGSRLAALIRARREEILDTWIRRVLELPAARALSEPALRDHAPEVLNRIAARLEDEAGGGTLEDLASGHALERLSEGFDIGAAAAELAALRDVIFATFEEGGELAIAARDVRILNAAIDEVSVRSVERFTAARERTLFALDRISSAALGTGDLETFLPRLLDVLLETTAAADSAYVLLRDAGTDVLRIRAAAGPSAALALGFSLRIGEGFAGGVALRREPMMLSDAAHDPMVLNPAVRFQGTRAMYAVPLVHSDEVVGVAKMASRTAGEFSHEDRQLFRAMAHRATSLIVQAQLVDELRRREADLRARAEFEGQLAGIVSHDLRSPLSAIVLGAHTLLARGGLDAAAVATVQRIHRSGERAVRMIRDLLDFTRARVGRGIPVAPRPAELHAVARGVVDEVRAANPRRTIHLEGGEAPATFDPDRLAQVLTNLVVNALKYGTPDGAVTVRTASDDAIAAVEVHNEGNPIPADAQDALFQPYQRGDGAPDDRMSLGLGLYISREIVRAHGGTIEIRSSNDEGTTFTVRLPRVAARPAPRAGT